MLCFFADCLVRGRRAAVASAGARFLCMRQRRRPWFPRVRLLVCVNLEFSTQ